MLRGRGEGVRETKADAVGALEVEEERTMGVNGICDYVDRGRRVEKSELMDAIAEVGGTESPKCVKITEAITWDGGGRV